MPSRENPSLRGGHLGALQLGQMPQYLFLLFANFFRGFDVRNNDQVSAPPAPEVRDTFAVEAEVLAGLRAGGNVQVIGPFEGGDFNLTTEYREAVCNRNSYNCVVTFASENFMLLDPDVDVKVPTRRTRITGFTFILQPEARSCFDSVRNLERQFLAASDASASTTFATGVGNNRAPTLTGGTRSAYREETLRARHLPATAAH